MSTFIKCSVCGEMIEVNPYLWFMAEDEDEERKKILKMTV